MLVNFRVKNFKSFKNNTEFSMEATKLKNLKESNTFKINNISLLKSAVIYGANASGKSNLLDAMNKMKTILISSHSMQEMQTYIHEPFLLNTEFEKESTLYEIELIINDELYRYGFEIDEKSIILEEWLYRKKLVTRAKETKLFTRIQEKITIGTNFKEGKKLETKTRVDALFLSIVAQFNGDISLNILDWFYLDFKILSSLKSDEFKFSSFDTIKDNNYKKDIVKLLKSADVGIYDLDTKKISVEEFLEIHANNKELNGEFLKNFIEEASGEKIDNDDAQKIQTSHMKYDKNNEFKEFKYFDLSFESMEHNDY
jgi:AAA15 family ATPase/GTPase